MRSYIFVHRATTKYFSNSFVFKTEIEKEGLPGDITPALGAGSSNLGAPTNLYLLLTGISQKPFPALARGFLRSPFSSGWFVHCASFLADRNVRRRPFRKDGANERFDPSPPKR